MQDRQETDGKAIIVVLLNSRPADSWMAEADQLRRLAEQKQANVFVLALGGLSDAALLARLSPVGPLTLRSGTEADITRFFDWIHQVVDTMLTGLEQGAEGQRLSVPPLPDSVRIMNQTQEVKQ